MTMKYEFKCEVGTKMYTSCNEACNDGANHDFQATVDDKGLLQAQTAGRSYDILSWSCTASSTRVDVHFRCWKYATPKMIIRGFLHRF